jgi:hypothetical protein
MYVHVFVLEGCFSASFDTLHTPLLLSPHHHSLFSNYPTFSYPLLLPPLTSTTNIRTTPTPHYTHLKCTLKACTSG